MGARGLDLLEQGPPSPALGDTGTVFFCWQAGGVQTVGDSGAFQLGAQFLKSWCQSSQIVYIVSSQKGEWHPLAPPRS